MPITSFYQFFHIQQSDHECSAAMAGLQRFFGPEALTVLKVWLLVEAQWTPLLVPYLGFIPRHMEHPGSRHSKPASMKILSRPRLSCRPLDRSWTWHQPIVADLGQSSYLYKAGCQFQITESGIGTRADKNIAQLNICWVLPSRQVHIGIGLLIIHVLDGWKGLVQKDTPIEGLVPLSPWGAKSDTSSVMIFVIGGIRIWDQSLPIRYCCQKSFWAHRPYLQIIKGGLIRVHDAGILEPKLMDILQMVMRSSMLEGIHCLTYQFSR